MSIGWRTCILAVLLPHSLCRWATVNAPANRQMPIASVVSGNFRKIKKSETMTRKNNFTPTILLILLMTTICVYGQKDTKKSVNATVTKQVKGGNMTIDTFSSFPPEIDGCSCYFSNNSTELKKEKYIYVNDFAQTSFLKINGVMTKFTQTEHKKINKTTVIAKFISKNYEMTIEVKDGKQSSEETSIKTGIITLTDKNGNTITRNFYGECGC